MSPVGLPQCEPVVVGLEAELQEPFGFALFGRDETHHLFVEAAFYDFGVHVGGEAVFILLLGNGACQFVVSHKSFVFLRNVHPHGVGAQGVVGSGVYGGGVG